MKYYIIGDTGGHFNLLLAGLETIGVNTSDCVIPEDITIIHLGDLIHKGPASSLKALNFVRKMQANNEGRWIQLLGNHELQHLEGAIPFWRCNCGQDFEEILSEMFTTGDVRIAYGVKGLKPVNLTLSARDTYVPKQEDWLFTHGGLTKLWWMKVHNSEEDTLALADHINALPMNYLTSPGARLGYPMNPASPVWASAPDEVFPGWYDAKEMPFNQAFGHTYIYDWERGRWFGRPSRELRSSTKLNTHIRASITLINKSVLLCVDPGFEKDSPNVECQPVILIGETN